MNMLEYNGGVYTISELSLISGLPRQTIEGRLHRGWPVDRAVETPVNTKLRRVMPRAPKPIEGDMRYNDAMDICRTISGDPEAHNFRKIGPDVYGFDGDILSWRFTFSGEDFHLTAFYRTSGMQSTLSRTYSRKNTKEVNAI